jgi:hypothetical protein
VTVVLDIIVVLGVVRIKNQMDIHALLEMIAALGIVVMFRV